MNPDFRVDMYDLSLKKSRISKNLVNLKVKEQMRSTHWEHML